MKVFRTTAFVATTGLRLGSRGFTSVGRTLLAAGLPSLNGNTGNRSMTLVGTVEVVAGMTAGTVGIIADETVNEVQRRAKRADAFF